jgi:antitoxin component of MazEF toxin-antitoxin module
MYGTHLEVEMDVMKIRRQGNSLAVTLDQGTLGAANLHEGDFVTATVRGGIVMLTPVEVLPRARAAVLETGRRVIARNSRVLDRLANDDTTRVRAGRR